MTKKNLILVVAGGIGNQLFMYAAAKRLADKNGASLLLDSSSGFEDDFYQQTYQLDKLSISAQEAPSELLFNRRAGKLWRSALRRFNRWLPYDRRWIILEETAADKMSSFDPRLLDLKLSHNNNYMIGYFQCEQYFNDIRKELLSEFVVSTPLSAKSNEVAAKISSVENPIAVHARQLRGAANLDGAKAPEGSTQQAFSYYDKAVTHMAGELDSPHFFCFGDDPEWLEKNWKFDHPVTFVSHNNSQDEAVQDLHLMSLCSHFIIGNSTFSWWPAWLADTPGKTVIAPSNIFPEHWSGNRDVIPSSWIIH